ncbi:MAG: VOC family protein [Halofilum sp. (in: g-proteobacteria)]
MPQNGFVATSDLRARFCAAMSRMYRDEVPAYGTLVELVGDINAATLERDPALASELSATDGAERISEERHGAIRLGTAEELATMRRMFAVMGMYPVGYYDLTTAGIPVHSTAFRPLAPEALAANPFRVFTSLLRLDLIDDAALRAEAEAILARRSIFTDEALRLMAQAERQGGLGEDDAAAFIAAVLETFRWHPHACVDPGTYRRLHDAHRLIADVVSFRGPHINHLTPRTLDIDAVQAAMPGRGITPKAVIEGPPKRRCPILLRQTSFKALEEPVAFPDGQGGFVEGHHTARFGEIEQRGAALTPKGRARYDQLLAAARAGVTPAADGSNADAYMDNLARTFADFPDDPATIRAEGLAYFHFSLTDAGAAAAADGGVDGGIEDLIDRGLVRFDPIVYEDFLPVSAAGIFQSNLGDAAGPGIAADANRAAFEAALGATPADEFALYAERESASIRACLDRLQPGARAGRGA